LFSLFENLPLLFLSAPDHITMSSPADSVFQTVLPVNAMGIDLIERLELPSDSLYPEDRKALTSSLEARLTDVIRSSFTSTFVVEPGKDVVVTQAGLSSVTLGFRKASY
jgi:hypothetical protein